MTISTPALPSDAPPAIPGSGANPGLFVPADGFDQFMAAGLPVPDCSLPAELVIDETPVSTEQAAVLAASLLWAPLPLMAETPPPASEPTVGVDTVPQDPVDANEADGAAPAVLGETNPEETENAAGLAGVPAREFRVPQAPLEAPPPAMVKPPMPLEPKGPDQVSGVHQSRSQVPAIETAAVSATPAPAAAVAAESENIPSVSIAADRSVPRRTFRAVGDRQEKIADAAAIPDGNVPAERVDRAKTFVSITQQEVRAEQGIVGTRVAQVDAAMPPTPVDQAPSVASPTVHAPAGGQPLDFDLSVIPEPVEQARGTVVAVMSVIDALEKPESTGHRLVNLNFNFGEEHLAVRVEFRNGTVHAHFQTQSPELRAALSQEWSCAVAAPENVLRLAEPVFVAPDRAEQPASFDADGDAPRQQSQQSRTAAQEVPSRPATAGFRSAPVADLPEAPRLRQLPTALHLQAVA